MPFEFARHPDIPDVVLIQPKAFGDDRGWFQETYKRSDFERFGIPREFRQDNHSRSTGRGVLRGLHYQTHPMAQGKLVRCSTGAIFDVAVDIRKGSPTFARWVGVELTAENRTILWVPEGFAHGVCTLTDVAEVLYKATSEFSLPHDRSIRWNDPAIGVRWPIKEPMLSTKDSGAPLLADAENNFVWKGST